MIGIIGLGKLGLPLATIFSQHYSVVGVDYSEKRINQIKNNHSFFEPKLNEYLEKADLIVSTDYTPLKQCDPVFIIVQTPSKPTGLFNTKYVKHALEKLHKVNKKCLAVVSSTVNIGTIQEYKKTHKKLAYNPEFIKQGSIIHDFENPKFVLIGADSKQDYQHVSNIWKKIHSKPILYTSSKEAEAIKLILNFSYTLEITFANTIGEICSKHKLNTETVLSTVYKDQRNYMPGLGYGGPCFPRDVACLGEQCRVDNLKMGVVLTDIVKKLNQYPMKQVIRKIKEHGAKSVTILGVAYKQGVPYVWESQPIKIAETLIKEGVKVHIYDEYAGAEAAKVVPSAIYHSSINDAIKQGEVIVIGTPNYSELIKKSNVIDPWKN